MLAPTRRRFIRGLAMAGCSASALPKMARAACPLQRGPVRWIVPNAAGGGYDALSRLVEPSLEESLGVRIQIDNVPGAGGLRGATVLRDAKPDGSVLGIISLPALLMASTTDVAALDPVESFALLGTIAGSRHVWSTGASTQIRTIDDVLRIGRSRGLVFAANSFNSLGFFTAAIPCAALGLRAEFVTGFGGSSASALATIRGDVDLISLDCGTQGEMAAGGDLRPLLRIGSSNDRWPQQFDALRALTGPDGLAAAAGPKALADSEALVRFVGTGRVIAAPQGLPAELAACLEEAVCRALSGPSMTDPAAIARWSLDPICAQETLTNAREALGDVRRLAPLAEAARAAGA